MATSSRTKHRESQRRRSNKKRSSLERGSPARQLKREDARKAVQLAALQAFESTTGTNESTSYSIDGDLLGGGSSFDYSEVSQSSTNSYKIAMHRELELLVDNNDDEDDDYLSSSSFGGNDQLRVPRRRLYSSGSSSSNGTATGSSPLSVILSKTKLFPASIKKRGRGGKRKKKKETATVPVHRPKEVWMCGICQHSFSSFEAAEKHETYHIKEVVMDLGWFNNDDIHPATTLLHNGNIMNINDGDRAGTTEPQSPKTPVKKSHPPRPDTLRMSSPLEPSSRVSIQPYTPTLQRKKLSTMNHRRFSDDFLLEESNDEFNLTTSLGLPKVMSPIFENDQCSGEISRYDDMVSFVLADEALVDVCNKAESLILDPVERQAEAEMDWLTKDKAYYDLLRNRLQQRKGGGTQRYRTEGKSALSKVQNKFIDAYQLMKEGKSKQGSTSLDYYTRKLKGGAGNDAIIDHTKNTFYVNVMVKNSIAVVRNELERLAKQRWEDSQRAGQEETNIQRKRFQKFRAVAQDNLVKLAGYALASDFTPRRIAVQLSNDLYRLLAPKLKRRGVDIETEIEYRVGPYFVLAVNVRRVEWGRLVRVARRDVDERKKKWTQDNNTENSENSGESDSNIATGVARVTGVIVSYVNLCLRLTKLTRIEVVAEFLAFMYLFHWVLYTPTCFFLYLLFPKTFRTYFLTSVADEILNYVEQKGMHLDMGIRDSSTQAAFMLSALREMRAGGQEKKKQQDGDAATQIVILGPLLGPIIKGDKDVAPAQPPDFEIPPNLEFVGLELDIPVGFKRLRWALLSSQSTFITEAVFRAEAKYENIETGQWSKFDEVIGLSALPDGTTEADLIGAEKEMKYLMPKSAFVKANMCYETAYIEAYNDFCFCLKKKALTPEVPYGSTFVAWTKFVVLNTGKDSCRMICSLEAEFPNGPPMVSRQIQSGMKAGVGELFVKIGETITQYADEYP